MNRIAVLILLLTVSCSATEDKLVGDDTDSKSGEFRVLNYNIWGLPAAEYWTVAVIALPQKGIHTRDI
jgi:hypothetical protein